jgi:hypothetical protein
LTRPVRDVRWARRALRETARQLEAGPLEAVEVAPPPGDADARVLLATVRLSRRTCLVRALVRQRIHASAGRPRDLLVGVTGREGFGAHAWLAGDPEDVHGRHEVLLRRPAP